MHPRLGFVALALAAPMLGAHAQSAHEAPAGPLAAPAALAPATQAARRAGAPRKLEAMGENELRGTSAKGLANPAVGQLVLKMWPTFGPSGTTERDKTLFPLLGLFVADVTANDVLYAASSPLAAPNRDGSVRLPLPSWIGELDVQNIRVGAGDTGNFGNVQIRGIDFGRTTISISPAK